MPPGHDHLFHFLFSHARLAAAWVESVVPEDLRRLVDWGSFAVASERIPGVRLNANRPDLVFTARLRDSGEWVWFVVEHKSARATGWRAQVLRYVVHLRRLVQKNTRDPSARIVPIVLYHGREPLDDVATEPTPFDRFVPQIDVLVVDLQREPPTLAPPTIAPLLHLGLLCMHAVLRLEAAELLAAIDTWGPLWRAVEVGEGPPLPEDALDALSWYLVDHSDLTEEQVQMTISRHLQEPEILKMTTGQRIRQESRQRGRVEGRIEGRIEGRTEGRIEGQAATLVRQLTRRFGPLPEALRLRIAAGSQHDLDAWTDRILDAKALADVFVDA